MAESGYRWCISKAEGHNNLQEIAALCYERLGRLLYAKGRVTEAVQMYKTGIDVLNAFTVSGGLCIYI